MTADNKPGAPWHFWAVALVLVLWNGLATFDYVSSVVQGDAYYESSGMTAAQVAYFNTLPIWVTVAWTVSVWGALAGGVAFLFRRKLAGLLLGVATAGTAAYVFHAYALSDGRAAMGVMWPMPAIVTVILACLVGYVALLARQGIVR
ncbi:MULTISPECIES: hypothetical protein [Asticcacaulis]|uniref:hypothetical protein n=1 Tax=Asticcacaulis TaxID=76890 RepID=UPI001AE9F733|nr:MULTISPECIES: hypothetical protein [Asticcacaulis]MBP2157730.1 hypothetical protein [Asticcacaulis solisilvae]MDR6798775.1 hypothetical protein [Asticcacaulis sp. BE141]